MLPLQVSPSHCQMSSWGLLRMKPCLTEFVFFKAVLGTLYLKQTCSATALAIYFAPQVSCITWKTPHGHDSHWRGSLTYKQQSHEQQDELLTCPGCLPAFFPNACWDTTSVPCHPEREWEDEWIIVNSGLFLRRWWNLLNVSVWLHLTAKWMFLCFQT